MCSRVLDLFLLWFDGGAVFDGGAAGEPEHVGPDFADIELAGCTQRTTEGPALLRESDALLGGVHRCTTAEKPAARIRDHGGTLDHHPE